MQTHKIEKKQDGGSGSGGGASPQATQQAAAGGAAGGQQQEKYKHEGDSVNTEVRTTTDTIEFYAPGDKKVGLYDKKAKRWLFDADGSNNCTLEMLADKITVKIGGSSIELTEAGITLKATRIDHN
jgi:hypothetical protein